MQYMDNFEVSPNQITAEVAKSSPVKSKKEMELEELNNRIKDSIAAITSQPRVLQMYLDVQNRFPTFSVKNAILIMSQNPDLQEPADMLTWKMKGVLVSKKAVGVQIFAKGAQYTKPDGSIGHYTDVKTLYDISATNAKRNPVPMVHYDKRLLLKALIRTSPCKIDVSDKVLGKKRACYNMEHDMIHVRPGMSAHDVFQSLAEQVILRRFTTQDMNDVQRVFCAYCVSYMLCKRFGVDSEFYNFSVIPDYFSALDENGVIRELEKIQSVADKMVKDMEQTLCPSKSEFKQERTVSERGGG